MIIDSINLNLSKVLIYHDNNLENFFWEVILNQINLKNSFHVIK